MPLFDKPRAGCRTGERAFAVAVTNPERQQTGLRRNLPRGWPQDALWAVLRAVVLALAFITDVRKPALGTIRTPVQVEASARSLLLLVGTQSLAVLGFLVGYLPTTSYVKLPLTRDNGVDGRERRRAYHFPDENLIGSCPVRNRRCTVAGRTCLDRCSSAPKARIIPLERCGSGFTVPHR